MTTPNGEGVQSDAEGTQSGAGSPTGAGDGTGTASDGTQSGAAADITAGEPTFTKAEMEAIRARMQAADQRAARTEAELKQIRDKDLPEAEKLKRDYEESVKQVETLQATNSELALKVAFLEDNTYKWQNPKRAMQLVDKSQVTVEADGSVSGLKDALKALATSDPYLLIQEVKEEPTPPAGTAPGNNGGSTNRKPSTSGMAARIPALQTRVKRS